MNLAELRNITKIEEGRYLVKNVSFTIQHYQRIAISGATGSGKTTLLKILAGLVQPTEGLILFSGEKVAGPEEKLLPGHPQIAYLSQYFELRHHYRVEEVLAMANMITPEEAHHIYWLCQVTDFLKRWTHQLSGGERQRIALACLLIKKPALLILDEPFSNLDPFHKMVLKKVIADVCDRFNITCILVSHDALDTLSWATEIIVLQDGEIAQQGTPQQLYYHSGNDYIASLFGKHTRLNSELITKFAQASGVNEMQLTAYIRPEMFIISVDGKGIKGVITYLRFMGAYYEAEVNVEGSIIIANTRQAGLSVGSIVYLLIDVATVGII